MDNLIWNLALPITNYMVLGTLPGLFKPWKTTVKNCALLLEDHFYVDDGWKGGETKAGKRCPAQAIVDEGLD